MTRWNAPTPKRDGPEKRGLFLLDLVASGDSTRAAVEAVRLMRVKGKMVDLADFLRGADPSLTGPGSENWHLLVACGRYAAIGCPLARAWLIGYADRRWPLWRSETLSLDVYSFILHAIAGALRGAHERDDRELEDVLRDLVRRHVALLASLFWADEDALDETGFRRRVMSAGERNPREKATGERATTFLVACLADDDSNRADKRAAAAKIATAIRKGAATGAPERILSWARPAELGTSMTASEAALILREDVRLAVVLEVGRIPGGDGWTLIEETHHQSTAPTACTSVVRGKLHRGGVHPKGAREGLGRVRTRREGDRLVMTCRRVDTGEMLTGWIPAPPVAGAEVWHVGPGGWAAGAAG